MEARKTHGIGEDRLSNLPEPIIHHILSFLYDMKYVIPTSMLSQRWLNIWHSLPSISLSYYVFLYNEDKFIDFVNMVFSRRDTSPIQSFYLTWDDEHWEWDCIDRWIRTVVLRDAREIYVRIDRRVVYNILFEYPDCLFTSKSLTSLGLDFVHGHCETTKIELPDRISLPSLKSLRLESVNFSEYHNFFNILFTGCPALETLILMQCRITSSKISTISSLQLKHLHINMLPSANDQLEVFVIHTPNLLKYTWTSLSWSAFSLEGLSSLETACIHPGACYDRSSSKDSNDLKILDAGADKGMMECLKALCSVKHLTLSSNFLQLISELPSELEKWRITFNNLRYLNLQTWLTRGCFEVTLFLLKNSPNIETLVLRMFPIESEKTVEHGIESSFNLKLPHLKVVKFLQVRGCKNELQHMRILLGNAEALEKTIVKSWQRVDNSKEWKVFTAQVLTLPRASPDVRIYFRNKYG